MWWCMNEAIKMQLSAFVDGELPENEAEMLLRRLSQDAELRQQVAEFMAIGRAMRGEVQVSGIDDLRARVAAAIDEASPIEEQASDVPVDDRLVRPMAGFAIAATVALVAIFGLRQMSGVEGIVEDQAMAGDTATAITQPPVDEILQQYRMMHDMTATESGANNISDRLNTVEVRLELLEDNAAIEAVDEDEDEDEEAEETATDDTAVE